MAKAEGFQVYAMTFSYGQRHKYEVEASQRIANHFAVVKHVVVPIDLRVFGCSALTSDLDVPKDRPLKAISNGIPNTYVPARNTIFLSFALAWAEVLLAHDIYLGVNAVDYSGYPDCRPEYIEAYENMARLATKAGVEGNGEIRVHTPLITLSKAEIVQKGIQLGVNYGLTSTCYDPNKAGIACGRCDACLLRLKGFADAGFSDPIQYQ